MLIGVLAQESGFSRDTIRYYEKIGLLRLPKRARRENNYKEYSPAILSRLHAIKLQLLEAIATCPNHCKITAILDKTLVAISD